MGIIFPPVDEANEDGLLAIGGNLDVPTLKAAYTHGIFPWPVNPNYPLTWFAPDPRGIIVLNEFKINRSVKKFLNKTAYTVKFNHDFSEIITQCSQASRKHEKGTWIYPSIIKGYTELFQEQFAYCVGVYEGEQLIGGLYGVCFGEIISGESMFHQKTNASKVALVALIEKLNRSSIPFLDTQMVTPVIASFGGKNITRQEFMQRLKALNPQRTRSDIFD